MKIKLDLSGALARTGSSLDRQSADPTTRTVVWRIAGRPRSKFLTYDDAARERRHLARHGVVRARARITATFDEL